MSITIPAYVHLSTDVSLCVDRVSNLAGKKTALTGFDVQLLRYRPPL